MRVYVLSSGSSGNAILVEEDGARLMLDGGIGPQVAARRLKDLGHDLFPRGVDGIVFTHHHGDHFSHAEPLARALRAPLYLHAGISARRIRARWDVRAYEPGVPFAAGRFTVRALSIPHDAPQVALAVESPSGVRFAVATDLGHVPAALAPFLAKCDAALVEANYCPMMLEVGPYPPSLRQRVRGGLGHLANEQTAELAAKLAGTRLGTLYLGHISRQNNTPEQALRVVRGRTGAANGRSGLDVKAIAHGVASAFEVARSVRYAGLIGAEQLALAFG